MTLYMLNAQGACYETRGLESMADVRAEIDAWTDPENMTARVVTDCAEILYDGVASDCTGDRNDFTDF